MRLAAQAEAEAIKALRNNPGLVALTQAERWGGQLLRTTLPGGSIPMLDLNAN